VIEVTQGWPVVLGFTALCIAAIIWMAHLSVHTQAKLAAHGEQDKFVDALVWLNRQLTGKPARPR
jgi:hypothetical protein